MTHDRRSTFRCVRLAAAALVLGIFTTAGIAGVSAQDASPEASPVIACESPGLASGATTESMASPEGAAEEATGTPADDETADAIFASVENYVACYNEGQATGDPGLYVALETANYVASQGNASREDEVTAETGSPFATMELISASDATVWSDGRASADVQIMVGDYWFNEWRWFQAEEDGIWKLDERVDLPPTPDVDFVTVNGINVNEPSADTDAFISLSGSWDFPETDAIVFNVTNKGTEEHNAFILQLPEGADPAGLFDGSLDMSTVSFIAMAASIMPDENVNLVLIDLPAGTYTLVDASTSSAQQFNVVAAEG